MLVQTLKTLTKLYPRTDHSYRDVIDLLKVVLYIILGHSVKTYSKQTEEKNTQKRREGERERENRGYTRHQASVFAVVRSGYNVCVR